MRTLFRAAIACVLAAASVVGPVCAATTHAVLVAQAAQQSGTLTGRVVSPGGTPLSGASITIQGNGKTQNATTGADGAFSFSLPAGLYTITVNHGGYQTASNDVSVVAGQPIAVNVSLVESTSSNLTVIGRTSAAGSGNQAKFNISSSASQSLSPQQIQERDVPNLAPVVNELPGLNVNHSASNPNQYFLIHGFSTEAKNTLDGHPVSSGTGGTFLTQFMQAGIFGGVDVAEGVGLNGPTAGQSGIGTINLRTPDFTTKNSGFIQGGLDSYSGSFYNALIDTNFLKDNRLSLILGRSLTGYAGPTAGYQANAITGPSIGNTGTYLPPYITKNLIAFQGDFSNAYNLNAELAKLRYKFSDATSLTLEYIGFQGRWDPQGGAYGQFDGFSTIPQCYNTSFSSGSPIYTPVAAGATGCTVTSSYNAPSAQGLVGKSNVPLYSFYPGSDVRQSQPNFSADFKTTLKNDTILFRPYAAAIRRLIDGSNESAQPGDAGAWSQVTNPANCTVAYSSPTVANGGAKGPCYLANQAANTAGYVNDPSTPHAFGLLPISALPVGSCTPTNPCYTSFTNQNNGGFYGFGSPYTTLEEDNLAGYTFTYIHPVGANIFNVSLDHYFDDARSFVNDASPIISGCTFTVSGGANPAPGSLGNQPTCTGLGGTLKPSPIQVPNTFSSVTDLSLTAQLQLRDNLEFDFGNYFTHYVINGQQINPATIAAYSAPGAVYSAVCSQPTLTACPKGYVANSAGLFVLPVGNPIAFIPVNSSTLVGLQNGATHYDPHFAFVYRPSRELAIRFNGGSSISIPYASQVSGFSQRQQSAISTTVTQPNGSLLPEEIVAEDLGADYRFKRGAVISADVYNIIAHNPWISSKVLVASGPSPTYEGNLLYQSQQLNGSQRNSQGIDASITNEPALGMGYRVTGALNRNYYLNQPPALFAAAPQTYYNGGQSPGVPYARGYAEVQYAGTERLLLRLGMDYEGPNNEYNFPSFFVFDAGLRIGFGNGFTLQMSAENLTAVNLNTNLAQGVLNQGTVPIAASNAGSGYAYSSPSNLGIVQPGFRTVRFSLSKRF